MGHPVTVSVIMPVYNRGALLEAAARSVLEGTYADLELLAIDDGSTDDSVSVLERLAARDPRVKVLRQSNSGAYAARNAAAKCASGRFLALQDADDVSVPERLARQVACMEQRPAVAALGGGLLMIDTAGRAIRTVAVPTGDAELKQALQSNNPIHTTTVMIRRSAFESAGGFRPVFRAGGDYDLWLRLGERHELGNLPEPLAKYRVHGDQISTRRLGLQVAGMLASQAAARERRRTGRDSLETAEAITPELLESMGVAADQRRAAELEAHFWWAELMCDAGEPAAAADLLGRAAELAHDSGAVSPVTARIYRGMTRVYAMQGHRAHAMMAKVAARLLEGGWAGAGTARWLSKSLGAKPGTAGAR